MEKKFFIGDKVKVVSPCKTSENPKGKIGYVVDIDPKGMLSGVGGNIETYLISEYNNTEQYDQNSWWEYWKGLKLIKRSTIGKLEIALLKDINKIKV